MMNSNLQILSWSVSFLVGIFYLFMLDLFFNFVYRKNIFIRIIYEFIFVIISEVTLVVLYYKLNGGVIHYSYLLFIILGFFTEYQVKQYVKRHKN